MGMTMASLDRFHQPYQKELPRFSLFQGPESCCGQQSVCSRCRLSCSSPVRVWRRRRRSPGVRPRRYPDPSDVLTEGGLVDSVMFSNANPNSSTTVNGVTFDRAVYPGGGPPYPENSAAGKISTLEDNSQASNAPATGNMNYDTLLSYESYTTPGNYYNIMINGLTAGHEYSVQLWVDDQFSTSNPGQNDLFLYGGPAQTDGVLVPNGDYIIGHFTADGTTETFQWGGNPVSDPTFAYGTLDALQVREVPEPSTLVAFVGMGVMGLFLIMRRRRSA